MNDTTHFSRHDDFLALLQLDPVGAWAFTSRQLDGNQNGRVFGGQLLAHAVSAAAAQAGGRHLSSLRLGFLQGALAGLPIHWSVALLQEGSRFSNFHLRATQGSRVIADAQVTLQVSSQCFEHSDAMPKDLPPPLASPSLAELEARIRQSTGRDYELQNRPFLDLRFLDADSFLLQTREQASLRYWIKAREPLPDDPTVHAAALAYLSDFWFNYAALASHTPVTGARDRLYVSSLNHSLWSYAPVRADEWLLFDTVSPRAADGRGLTWAKVYTSDGRMVACAAQEMVCSLRNDPA